MGLFGRETDDDRVEFRVERIARKPEYQESHETRVFGQNGVAVIVRTVPSSKNAGTWPYCVTVGAAKSGDVSGTEYHVRLQHEELRLLIETLTRIENDVATKLAGEMAQKEAEAAERNTNA